MHKHKNTWTLTSLGHKQWLMSLLAVLLVGYALIEPATALYAISTPEEDVLVFATTTQDEDSSPSLLQSYFGVTAQGEDIDLTSGQTLEVTFHGEVYSTTTQDETISDLLSRLNLSPGPLDLVVADFTQEVLSVLVDANFTYYEQVEEESAYQTIRVPNPTMAEGSEVVMQAGVKGHSLNTYELVYADGALLSRQLVNQENSTAVDEIIEYGTATPDVGRNDPLVDVVTFADGSGYLSFASGATLPFSSTKAMTATAYTGGVGKVGWITASGTDVHVGVIAVDKSVIPLGTKLFVVTDDGIVYGTGVAEDTGVLGDIVDLYHDTYDECINFGRRSCTVYFVD